MLMTVGVCWSASESASDVRSVEFDPRDTRGHLILGLIFDGEGKECLGDQGRR